MGIDEYSLNNFWPFARICHCLMALVVGTAAGILARLIFPAPSNETLPPTSPLPDQAPATPRRWPWAAGVVLAILYAIAAAMGMRKAPVLWAGTTVLMTWERWASSPLAGSSTKAVAGHGRSGQSSSAWVTCS